MSASIASRTLAAPNAASAVQQRVSAGRVPARHVALMVFARFGFIVLVQLLVAGIFLVGHSSHPLPSAGAWWMTSGTLVDIGCLALLVWLTRREGIRLGDLLNLDRKRIGRDVLLGFAYLIAVAPALGINALLTRAFYGSAQPPQVSTVAQGHLPAVAVAYTILVWPVIWGFTEQMSYVGYTFPRLEALTGRTWLAALMVGVVWSAQHIALPFVPDARYLAFRFLTVAPVAATTFILYLLGGRRLLPLVLAHWALDASAAGLALMALAH